MVGEIAIVDGVRTPFSRAGKLLRGVPAAQMARIALRELIDRTALDPALIDHVVIGNVSAPDEAANVARVIAIEAGLPPRVSASVINLNGASGLEAIAAATRLVATGAASVVVAGGVESMSRSPLLLVDDAEAVRADIPWLRPRAAVSTATGRRPAGRVAAARERGAVDPLSGLHPGESAEMLAKEWKISREAQDDLALLSHRRAVAARPRLAAEIVPVYPHSGETPVVAEDEGPDSALTAEDLAGREPIFDGRYGTVTAGNAAGIADGAAICLVTSVRRARELGLHPLARIRSHAVVGVEPARMGLGPAHATPRALDLGRVDFRDIQLIEMHEAFAAFVLANEAAFASRTFAAANLGRGTAIGEIDRDRLNVNGGAIALGHPVGASGARLVLTLIREMDRRDVNLGLVTVSVGGGQGAAMVLER